MIRAVGRLGGQIAKFFELGGEGSLLLDLVAVAGERLLVGVKENQPLVAVDDDRFAAGDVGEEVADADDGGNAETFGDDGRVAAGSADLGDQAHDELRIEIRGFAGGEIVGEHQHRGGDLGELLPGGA